MCLCPFDQLFDVVGTSAGLLACERWHVVGRYVYNALTKRSQKVPHNCRVVLVFVVYFLYYILVQAPFGYQR
jgi:hypothetical protein